MIRSQSDYNAELARTLAEAETKLALGTAAGHVVIILDSSGKSALVASCAPQALNPTMRELLRVVFERFK